ncbi:ribonuclease E inhibitor RraB [Sphingomonas sp. RS6]
MRDAPDLSVAGDNDSWILLDRQTEDGYPLVVLARTGNASVVDAVRNDFVTVVRAIADSDLVNDGRMPLHSDRLYPVEEGIAQALSAIGVGALHVASITGDGQRRMIYTHGEPLDFAPLLERFCPDGYALNAGLDEKQSLIDLITPTAIDVKLNGDMSVISHLEKNGDDGTVQRRTDFWFYGDTERLAELAEELGQSGFVFDRWLAEPDGVVLSRETSVDLEIFRNLTPMLVDAAEKHGVEYDGWETSVVRSGDDEVTPAVASKPISILTKIFGAKKN